MVVMDALRGRWPQAIPRASAVPAARSEGGRAARCCSAGTPHRSTAGCSVDVREVVGAPGVGKLRGETEVGLWDWGLTEGVAAGAPRRRRPAQSSCRATAKATAPAVGRTRRHCRHRRHRCHHRRRHRRLWQDCPRPTSSRKHHRRCHRHRRCRRRPEACSTRRLRRETRRLAALAAAWMRARRAERARAACARTQAQAQTQTRARVRARAQRPAACVVSSLPPTFPVRGSAPRRPTTLGWARATPSGLQPDGPPRQQQQQLAIPPHPPQPQPPSVRTLAHAPACVECHPAACSRGGRSSACQRICAHSRLARHRRAAQAPVQARRPATPRPNPPRRGSCRPRRMRAQTRRRLRPRRAHPPRREAPRRRALPPPRRATPPPRPPPGQPHPLRDQSGRHTCRRRRRRRRRFGWLPRCRARQPAERRAARRRWGLERRRGPRPRGQQRRQS